MIFKIIGAVGLGLIAIGIINKDRKKQDLFYICGGVCLEAYSIYIVDWIFIVLQALFVLAAVYDLYRLKTGSKS